MVLRLRRIIGTIWGLFVLCLPGWGLENEEVEVQATDLLQQKYKLQPTCGFEPGIHLVKLTKLKRQFVFMVPRKAASNSGTPAFMFFHGVYQTPWFSVNILGLPDLLEHYGWFAILPWGKYRSEDFSMGGLRQCCSPLCDSDECCLASKEIAMKDHACGFWPKDLQQNLAMVDAIFEWMASNTCIDTSKVFAGGFSYGGYFTQDLACLRSSKFQGFAPNAAPGFPVPFRENPVPIAECKDQGPETFISFCGSFDTAFCFENSEARAAVAANHSRCTGKELQRRSATVNCTVWTGCHDEHVVESCMVYHLDHEISGHVAPDDTTFLHPASDLDYTTYIFEKFSLRVEPHQIRFYGVPSRDDELWKQSTWPLQKQFDFMHLRKALAAKGMETLPDGKVTVMSTFEVE
ncbi:unnamed protein product [Durusdinium trenchii]|uniref:Uncharacterized protein n=2 Tax=Durusdinium trenchii TaxID=1381693 RepID=A0ABP0L558_9DINO